MKMNKMKRETQITPLEALIGFSDRVAGITEQGLSDGAVQFSATIVSIVNTKTIEISVNYFVRSLSLQNGDIVLIKDIQTRQILIISVVVNIRPTAAGGNLLLENLRTLKPNNPEDLQDLSGLFRKNQGVIVDVLKLPKGSDALPAQLELAYAEMRSLPGKSTTPAIDVDDIDVDDGVLKSIDINGDDDVTSNEIANYAADINEAVVEGAKIDATEVAAAIDDAGLKICKADFWAATPAFQSETVTFPILTAEIFTGWEITKRGAGTLTPEPAVLIDLPLDPAGLQSAWRSALAPFGFDKNAIEDLDSAFETRKQFRARIAEIKSEEELNDLLVELKEMQKDGDLPKYLVRCCVKMVDPVTGDKWPEYEVCGVRKIRKRPTIRGSNVKGKGKCCEKYYRLECKKTYDSTRTGEFQGIMHFECQYMNMIDVVNAVGDAWGWGTGG